MTQYSEKSYSDPLDASQHQGGLYIKNVLWCH